MILHCNTPKCPHPFVDSLKQTMPMHKKQCHLREYRKMEARRYLAKRKTHA